MKVLFATNRRIDDNNRATDVLSDDSSFGEATVMIEKESREAGEKVRDSAQIVGFTTTSDGIRFAFDKLTSDVKMRESANVQTSVLMYIHGFRNSFKDAIERGAKLAHIYSSDAHQFVPFVLSWPSHGELSQEGFNKAQINAHESGKFAAEIYDEFVKFELDNLQKYPVIPGPCSEMFLVAHSMGVYMLRHMVQNIKKRETSLFKTAILAAANEHRDALGCEDQLRPLSDLARQVVVYSYLDDGTLNLGYLADLYEFRECLGLHGPSPKAFQNYEGKLSAVKCEDVVPSNFSWKHGYHHRLSRVVYDIRQVFFGKTSNKIPSRRKVKGGVWRNTGASVYRLKPR